MKKLPVGLSSLEKMIKDDHIYVDKTPLIQQLVETGQYYFLSRPRRFGKSLLVDTLHQLFAGNEELFRGLHIHPHWDWSVNYPVIVINFAKGLLESRAELEQRTRFLLQENQQRLGVQCDNPDDLAGCFSELIRKAKVHYGKKVVLLIDEYDKPILDNIRKPEIAESMRDGLRDFYSVIKGHDADIHFTLLTGVSKFSKVSLFSGLNILNDITLDEKFSALCGYTQHELEYYFADYLEGVDREQMQRWYNGYGWLGERVYNPFDVLLFFYRGQKFLPYWFETGTPTFLLDVLRQRPFHLPDLENVPMEYKMLGDFDVDRIHLETLLWQTGYLTIQKEIYTIPGVPPDYVLSYPNHEVRFSLMSYFLDNYLTDTPHELGTVRRALLRQDFAQLEQQFRALFDGIAHENYRNNPIARYEGYYAAVMYAFLCALGLETAAEVSNNKGRIDMTLQLPLPDGKRGVYILEFKMVESEQGDGSALRQIKASDYAAPYRDGRHNLWLVGIEFSEALRNIARFEWEPG
ncbi:MAG: AAA family ATPase [Thiolinea sp.]